MAATNNVSSFAARGPFPVGVMEISVRSVDGRDLPVWIWYPAQSTDGCAPATHVFGSSVPYNAYENAPVASLSPGNSASWPLILFSHGNAGIALQSTFLTTHLASWGFVVAAPEHVGNTFPDHYNVTDEMQLRKMHVKAVRNRPQDMESVLRVLTGQEKPISDPPIPLPKTTVPALGITGHSFGGWTSLKAASMLPIRAAAPLAPAGDWFVGPRASQGVFPQKVPTMVIAAKLDVLIDYEKQMLPLARMMDPTKSRFIVMPRADHM